MNQIAHKYLQGIFPIEVPHNDTLTRLASNEILSWISQYTQTTLVFPKAVKDASSKAC
jgi:hypothetical protein